MSRKQKRYRQMLWFVSVMVCSLVGIAAEHPPRLLIPADNAGVDGANGVLYVTGTLTESPCRLTMASADQSVVMGNTETAELRAVGSRGKPVSFQIELQDCLEMTTLLSNPQTGQTVWSSTQPAVKIRFTAPTVQMMPNVVLVRGVQGLGLEISNAVGLVQPLYAGGTDNPQLLVPGQNTLTYNVTPVRTAGILQAGSYSAVITFEMLYE